MCREDKQYRKKLNKSFQVIYTQLEIFLSFKITMKYLEIS